MPNINGTNNDDDIDVTDDDGTLNGDSQGSPIDVVRGRGGDDTITITNSTISGQVRGQGGADDITIIGSTVSATVNAGVGADTVSVQGSEIGDIRLAGGNDTLNFISSDVSGDVRGGGGTDSLNLPVGTVINDSSSGSITVTSGGSYTLSSGTFTLPSGTVITYSQFENGTGFPCFSQGTLLETLHGSKRVDQLKIGDKVQTYQGETQRIRWIGSRHFARDELLANPKLLPICITAGALGDGLPKRDLLVSQQHRMLVQSVIADRMFGTFEVLVPAIRLIDLPGIFIDEAVRSVEYFHLLFDRHEIIYSEGSLTESLFTGPEALRSISQQAREEILAIFPELADANHVPEPARFIPPGRLQKKLIARHLKNKKPLTPRVPQPQFV